MVFLSDERLVFDESSAHSIPILKQLISLFGAHQNYSLDEPCFHKNDIRSMVDTDEATSIVQLNGTLGSLIEYELAWGNTHYSNVKQEFDALLSASLQALAELDTMHRSELPETSFLLSLRQSDELSSLFLSVFTAFEFDGVKFTAPYPDDKIMRLHDYVHEIFNDGDLCDTSTTKRIWSKYFINS